MDKAQSKEVEVASLIHTSWHIYFTLFQTFAYHLLHTIPDIHIPKDSMERGKYIRVAFSQKKNKT